MQTCESCGASFERASDLTEVTSLRILCPACAAARAAAKAKKAAQATAPPSSDLRPAAERPRSAAGAPRPTAAAETPAARPAPRVAAAKPAGMGAKPAGMGAKPAGMGAKPAGMGAKPAGMGAKPAGTAAKPAAAAKSAPSTPAPSAPEPASAARSSAAPMPAKKVVAGSEAAARPGRPAPKKKKEIELASKDLKKKGTRELLVAIGVAFLVFAVAGGVLWKVMGTHKAENDAEQARLARIEDFRVKFFGLPMDNEEQAAALITFAEENRPIWLEEPFATDVVSRQAKARDFIETQQKRRELTQRLDGIEAILAKAAELPPSELAEMRRGLEELAGRAEIMGAEFLARVSKDRQEAERVYVERLISAAQAAGAGETLDRVALTTVQQSEDELFKIFNAIALAAQKNRSDQELTAKKNELQEKYKALLELSDTTVTRFFTPDEIERTPWRDALSDEHKGEWKGAQTFKGVRIENGEMHLIGLDPGTADAGQSILSIGDKEIWRDFVVDMEFTIVQGSAEVFFRMPLAYQENIESIDLGTDEGQLEVGKTYTYNFKLVGSTLVDELVGESDPNTTNVQWTRVRKGAFALSLPKGAEVKITRLRVRVLRYG